jgi:methylmalonyl-CoA/ethylmalonyl-CoA epimerase
LLAEAGGVLHHLGFVVPSIAVAAKEFSNCMSSNWDGQVIHDPLQRVRVAFFTPVIAQNPVFELVEPAGHNSPVNNFLRKGGGLHHVCYEVDDLKSALQKALAVGFVLVARPTPAVAFKGRDIAWICSKNRLLIELLERHRQ